MKQAYYHVQIRRDAVETSARDAASTEIPVLQAIYGEAMVLDKSTRKIVDRADITPEDEFTRLCARYGKEAVMAAYGTEFGGVREIEKMLKDDSELPEAQAAAAEVDPNDPFLQQKPEDIIEQIPELEDGALAAYLAAEKAKKRPRKKVLEALESEAKLRAEEDAADPE